MNKMEKKLKELSQNLEKKEKKFKIPKEIENLIPEENIYLFSSSTDELFCKFDPSPLCSRHINEELEEHCLNQLSEVHAASKLKIFITVPDISEQECTEVKSAFINHFKTKALKQLSVNKKTSRKWRINTLIGLTCLAVCLIAAQIFSLPKFEDYGWAKVLSESLGILGWVAIWEPAEFFLYGWKENVNQLNKYIRLHLAEWEIICQDKN